MDDLLVDFIAETRETLDMLSGEIVAWEADPADHARLDAIFRFVHTVKGSCGFLNLARLEQLAHAAEEVLAACRAGKRHPDAALVTAVLAVIDRIATLTNALETGESVPDADDHLLVAALDSGGEVRQVDPVAASALHAMGTARHVSRSIRLPVELLDRMMIGVSDVVLARNDLARHLFRCGMDPQVEAAFARLSQSIGDMRDAVTRSRMARIETLFSALPRLVRDLAAELGKQVVLETDGGDVELDREMIEMIRDPLMHIVRNAIDHGIERPSERLAAGKAPQGCIRISARQAGNRIEIDAIDDGRGIDGEGLVSKAVAAGLLGPAAAGKLEPEERLDLIFLPGLSTAETVSAISGRGVGMDVVRDNVERIGGMVEVVSEPGQGVRLTMRVPLTLTIIPALTVVAGGLRFAVPRAAIEELVRLRPGTGTASLSTLVGAPLVTVRGNRLPVVPLGAFLGLGDDVAVARQTWMVVRAGRGGHFVLAVDRVEDHEELVIKPAAPALMETGLYAGTTLNENSEPMLLLDLSGIAQQAGIETMAQLAEMAEVQPDTRIETLLFRDLDGVERAVPLLLVARIDDVRADMVSGSGDAGWIMLEDKLTRFVRCPGARLAPRRVLRLTDGALSIAYGIDEVIDICALEHRLEPAATPGLVAGMMPVDGRPVELIDPHWLFAAHDGAQRVVMHAGSPVCLLSDDSDAWTFQILAPLLQSAGYRVVTSGDPMAIEAQLLILNGRDAEEGRGLPLEDPGPAVIRLTSDPARSGPGVVYRYDRERLLEMMSHAAGERRALQ